MSQWKDKVGLNPVGGRIPRGIVLRNSDVM